MQSSEPTTTTIPTKPVRRIVTGHDAAGRSIIVSDGPTPNVYAAPFGPSYAQVPWALGPAAAPGDEPAPAGHHFPPSAPGSTILRIIDFPPDDQVDVEKLHQVFDSYDARGKGDQRHFFFHKTESVDFAVCLEGEVYALLDEGETIMRPGDVLIQRATNHSWSNRSDKHCRMLFVLIAE
jgi:hypothetical protein